MSFIVYRNLIGNPRILAAMQNIQKIKYLLKASSSGVVLSSGGASECRNFTMKEKSIQFNHHQRGGGGHLLLNRFVASKSQNIRNFKSDSRFSKYTNSGSEKEEGLNQSATKAAAGDDEHKEEIIGKNRNFCSPTQKKAESKENMENKNEKINVNKEELKKRLTPLQYQVTQEAATERPFTGCYNKHHERGVYQCIVCHQDLFSSDTKYDSGCGWPAFNDVLDKGKITLHRDASIPERIRTEVRCSRCSAHMGHVFEDGPKPTRKRYCINSASIEFVPAEVLNQNSGSNAASTAATPQQTPIAQQ